MIYPTSVTANWCKDCAPTLLSLFRVHTPRRAVLNNHGRITAVRLTASRNLGLPGVWCGIRPKKELGVATGGRFHQIQPVRFALQHGKAVHVRADATLSTAVQTACKQ